MVSDVEMLRNSRGQGHLLTFAVGHLSAFWQHLQMTSSLKLLDQFKIKFHMQPPAKWGKKVIILGLGYITTMPIYGKTFYNNLLQNKWADRLETWYEAVWELVL